MARGSICFDRFALDMRDRRLSRGGVPVELNARYLDALALLVSEQGRLVSKDRFLEEVWRGVPVTDEALTQCIKTLRRALGDDAARPRFIETVPKHGYRFIAQVDGTGPITPHVRDWRQFFLLGGAGTMGGGVAGLIGGVFYGFIGASSQPGAGAVSMLLVLVCVTLVLALIGAAGVAFGMAGARLLAGREDAWTIAGAALGGMLVGTVVKLLGLDAFNLLVGQSPGDITGAPEGALLGAGVGLSVWLAARTHTSRRAILVAALIGGAAGAAIPLLGGRLMGGSLALLAGQFPGSRLRLGGLFGEHGFSLATQIATAAAEGALFSACIVAAIGVAQRVLTPPSPASTG